MSESCLFVVIILWPCASFNVTTKEIGEYKNYTPKGLGEIVLCFLTGVKKKRWKGRG